MGAIVSRNVKKKLLRRSKCFNKAVEEAYALLVPPSHRSCPGVASGLRTYQLLTAVEYVHRAIASQSDGAEGATKEAKAATAAAKASDPAAAYQRRYLPEVPSQADLDEALSHSRLSPASSPAAAGSNPVGSGRDGSAAGAAASAVGAHRGVVDCLSLEQFREFVVTLYKRRALGVLAKRLVVAVPTASMAALLAEVGLKRARATGRRFAEVPGGRAALLVLGPLVGLWAALHNI